MALAWSHRENNPELVQDEHEPQPRMFYEREEMLLRQLEAPGASLTSGRSKPPGRIVSTSAVLGPAGWMRRSKRDKSGKGWARDGHPAGTNGPWNDKDGSVFIAGGGFGRGRPSRLAPIHSSKALNGKERNDTSAHQGRFGGLILPEHMEFLAQYQAYTTTRKLLEDEGFFDTDSDGKKLAGEQFGFNQQELILNPPETSINETNEGEADFSNEAAEAGQKERQKATRRVVISAKPASSLVLLDLPGGDNDINEDGGGTAVSEGTASGQKDNYSIGTGGSRSSLANDRSSSAATATSDLMSRFYARLQELTETKDEDARATTNVDVATRNKDRMRIKTALRRLLNSRLFPDKAKGQIEAEDSKGQLSQPDDGVSMLFTPGTATPLTVESRSNIVSRQSRLNAEDISIKQGTRGKVIFVGESSHLTASSTDPPSRRGYPLENNSETQGHLNEEQIERVAYYRRHPLGPLKTGGISRLYQPVRPPSRSRTSISQASLQRDGLRGDKAFLQRLHNAQGVREDTRWSLPGEKGPDNYSSNARNGWRKERNPTSAWSYNMAKLQGSTHGEQKSPSDPSAANHDWLKDIDDLELRKLLEELYRDKKYMDRIINTKEADDQTELEVCHRLEDGRNYLLSRAMFWKEKGPLPPRPPTTELGLRLQRERTMQSRASNERTRVSRMESSLSGQETGASLSKEQDEDTPPANQARKEHTPNMQTVTSSTTKQQQPQQVAEPSSLESSTEAHDRSLKREQEKELSRDQQSDQGNVASISRSSKEVQEVPGQDDNNSVTKEAKPLDTTHPEPQSRFSPENIYVAETREKEEQLQQEQQQQQQQIQPQQQQNKESSRQETSKPDCSTQNVQYQEPQQQTPPQHEEYQEENRKTTPTSGFLREGSPKKIPAEEPKENIFIIAK